MRTRPSACHRVSIVSSMLKPLYAVIHLVSLRCVPGFHILGHTLPCPSLLNSLPRGRKWETLHGSLFPQYVNQSNKNMHLGSGNGLVKRSLKFVVVPSFAILTVPATTASLDQWYQILVCFFFRVESGIDAFLKTDSLSQKMLVGPSNGILNMRSLYLNASICSTTVFIVMNSLPKVLVLTVF